MSIKIENVVLPSPEQWAAVIRGMRNPLNSWSKSDSDWFKVRNDEDLSNGYLDYDEENEMYHLIGHNDLDLMQRLRSAGTEHRKFMRMIPVYLDITAPLYWFKEMDTYKVGTVTNSCSTMHKIHAKEFTVDDFSHDRLINTYTLGEIIKDLNFWRNTFLLDNDSERADYISKRFDSSYIDSNISKKDCWYQMIQLLPSSYNQKRTMFLNYEVLANMYHQRKNHKLDEWREFCKWIETLPYSELITGEEKSK